MIVGTFVFIDRVIFPRLEDDLRLVSKGWKGEAYYLGLMACSRQSKLQNVGVWMSPGIEVTQEKIKAKRIVIVGDSYVLGYPLGA